MKSDIKDKNGKIIKDKDSLQFIYKGEVVKATVNYNNGVFGVNTPNNLPFSCLLQDLKNYAQNYEII